jgi:hypothetical protein
VEAGGSFRSRNPVVLGRGSIPYLLVPIGKFLIFDGLIFFNLSFLIFKYIIKIAIATRDLKLPFLGPPEHRSFYLSVVLDA